jgi:3-phenylpropionate/cinnamic acid dioxygenase small subunit
MQEEALQQLLDRQAITTGLVEYCRALDRMDLPRLGALFTEDCVVDYGPQEALRSEGRAALEASLTRLWRWSRTSHHLTNVRIDFTGRDEARVESYVHAWHERADGSTATVFGQYHDHFVRAADAWLIALRRMLMNGCDAGFTVNINRFERIRAPAGWVAPNVDGERNK